MRIASLALLAGLIPGLALAEPQQPPQPGQPLPPAVRRLPPGVAPNCPPGDSTPACQARRETLRRTPAPARRSTPPQRRWDDITGARFVPPAIMAFLNDPRIDPLTRAFLHSVAAKPTDDWTLQELNMVMQLVPTLTEMQISTATLSEFYEFLGLDPTQLFTPQLGNWQQQSTGFDARSYIATQQAECFYLLGHGETLDPTQVTVGQAAACSDGAGQ